MEADYAPGRRNIGPAEVRRRLRLGLIGLAAGILLFLGLLWTDAPPLTRLVLALPLLAASLGFVQAACET
jgi:hypothetical protein